MKELLMMTDMEAEQLTWIHSNKFIVPELFQKKFLPDQTYRNACYVLKKYSSPEKGFLHINKANSFFSSYFFLTAGAIRTLDAKNKILVRSTRYPVKVNPFERQHDLMVQTLRVAFEASEELKNVFWVSDFEMRAGISPGIKAAFLEKRLNKDKWRAGWSNGSLKGRRTPDGYFEADMDGQRVGFTLELENHPYFDRMIHHMVDYLRDSYSDALKLVVSASKQNALRMIKALGQKINSSEQHKWFVSDFEKATKVPFKQIWHQLDHSGEV